MTDAPEMTDARKMLAASDRWRRAWSPPDRRPIWEWARENVELVGEYRRKGPFHASEWMKPIFDDFQNHKVREIRVRKGVRCGGSLIPEIFLCWDIVEGHYSVMWTMQNEQMMEDHVKQRIWPLLENGCPTARALLPPRGPNRTTDRIFAGAFSVVFNAANTNSLQSKGTEIKINDETWLPPWQKNNLYRQACSRVQDAAAIGLSKIYDSSQAGHRGDVEDRNFIEGHQAELNIRCMGCGKSTPLMFSMKREDKSRAGVIIDPSARQPDGYWNVTRACEMARYECFHCGHAMSNTPAVREHWSKTEHFIPVNLKAPESSKSYHIETLVYMPMADLVKDFCNAYNALMRGLPEPMKVFKQQQQAIPWEEETQEINLRASYVEGYLYSAYAEGEIWEGEDSRCMTIDRQKVGFWVEVRAWKKSGDSRQLYAGHIMAVEAVRELQLKLKVKDARTLEDCGYDQSGVFNDAVRFGWTPLRGYPKNQWMTEVAPGITGKTFYSDPQPVLHNGRQIYFLFFSADDCKDILSNLLAGSGARWDLPKNVTNAYIEHQKAEHKIEKRPGVWTWEQISQRDNHHKDTSNMQVVFALIYGYLGAMVQPDNSP